MTRAIPIEANNLSLAWAKAFLQILDSPGTEQSLLTVTMGGLSNTSIPENEHIRSLLNQTLLQHGKNHVDTVASTIFPRSLWNRQHDRHALFARYGRAWPHIHNHRLNRNGTYFQRLSAFGIVKDDQAFDEGINQLEHIIQTYQRENHRRSALQASVFNPERDHTHQRQRGFPCLQMVSFHPDRNRGLTVFGDYAIQNIFEKAYGNYLGLARLGQFMASEMGLELSQIICTARVAKLGRGQRADLTKREVHEFADSLRPYLE